MADKTTESSEMLVDMLFVDGDTRRMTIPNPKTDSETEGKIEALDAFLKANNFLIGDKYGGTFGRINKATKRRRATTTLDINS